MNFIHYMTLTLFIVWKRPYEVPQTFLTILEAATTCSTSILTCDTMVSDISYPEIYSSREGQKGKEMGG